MKTSKRADAYIRTVVTIAFLGATASLMACTPQAEDLTYPDLARTPTRTIPAGLMTQEEKEAAIRELRAKAGVTEAVVREETAH